MTCHESMWVMSGILLKLLPELKPFKSEVWLIKNSLHTLNIVISAYISISQICKFIVKGDFDLKK